MTIARRRLPNRCASQLIDYEVAGRKHTASIGFYPDGRLGQVFISASKSGSDSNIAMIEAGIALSFALQYGATIDEMRAAFPRTEDGRAEGAIGHLLDLLAKPKLVGVT